jgi:hypothetical protein
VEVSRKHGPFDTRWPCARKDNSHAHSTAALLSAAETAEALDWQAFSARYFPERRRHDSEAASAYADYKQGREWRTPRTRLHLVPSEPGSAADDQAREEAGTRRLMAAMAAAHPREAEGRLPR